MLLVPVARGFFSFPTLHVFLEKLFLVIVHLGAVVEDEVLDDSGFGVEDVGVELGWGSGRGRGRRVGRVHKNRL